MWLRYFFSIEIILFDKNGWNDIFLIIASAKIYNLMKSLDSDI